MAAIRIRVGAALDASLVNVFRPFEQAARKARTVAAREMKGAGQEVGKEADAAAGKAAKAYAKIAEASKRAADQEVAAANAAAQKKVQAELRAFDARIKASKKARDAEEREILQTAAAAERAAARKEAADKRAAARKEASDKRFAARQSSDRGGQREHLARDFGWRTVNNIGAVYRRGVGLAGEIARGAGVDTSISSIVGKNVDLQRQATEISNSGYRTDAKGSEDRVPQAKIVAAVKGAADAVGGDRGEVMGGLQAFTAKTGDLRAGLAILDSMSKLAKATGTDLGDMASAAGDVSNALGDDMSTDEKAKRIKDIMAAVAAQGKQGAVEIRDMAVQMAALGAAAGSIEGDAGANLVSMGAFAQMSRKSGGSKSSPQSATAVSAMINTLKTPARIAAFRAEDINVMGDSGMVRDPFQIMLASLSKTGGDSERMKKLFANVQGERGIQGFANIYRRTRAESIKGGASEKDADAAAIKKVTESYERLANATMTQEEISESLAQRMQDSDTKAQLFNNRLQDIAERVSTQVFPALEKLAPAFMQFAEGFGKLVGWAAKNPGEAITAAIVGSIAKAGLGVMVTETIKKMLAGGGAGGVPGVDGPGGGGGKALPVAAAGVAGFVAGKAIVEDAFSDKENAENRVDAQNTHAVNVVSRARAQIRTGTVDPETLAALEQEEKRLEARVEVGRSKGPSTTDAVMAPYSGALNWLTAGAVGTSFGKTANDAAERKDVVETARHLAEVRAAIDAMRNGELRVRVVNQPAQVPGVDSNARTRSGGEPTR